jgi:hypothetical protein
MPPLQGGFRQSRQRRPHHVPPRVEVVDVPARRAESIQPGVSTPGRRPRIDKPRRAGMSLPVRSFRGGVSALRGLQDGRWARSWGHPKTPEIRHIAGGESASGAIRLEPALEERCLSATSPRFRKGWVPPLQGGWGWGDCPPGVSTHPLTHIFSPAPQGRQEVARRRKPREIRSFSLSEAPPGATGILDVRDLAL